MCFTGVENSTHSPIKCICDFCDISFQKGLQDALLESKLTLKNPIPGFGISNYWTQPGDKARTQLIAHECLLGKFEKLSSGFWRPRFVYRCSGVVCMAIVPWSSWPCCYWTNRMSACPCACPPRYAVIHSLPARCVFTACVYDSCSVCVQLPNWLSIEYCVSGSSAAWDVFFLLCGQFFFST